MVEPAAAGAWSQNHHPVVMGQLRRAGQEVRVKRGIGSESNPNTGPFCCRG